MMCTLSGLLFRLEYKCEHEVCGETVGMARLGESVCVVNLDRGPRGKM